MLKGTLDDFTLPDMFRLMSFAKKTGRLDVKRRAGHGSVFFREGEVYYAESSLTKIPLGQKLLRAGVITESQLNKALDANAESGERVGEILMQTGVVDGEQLETALRAQIEDAVFDLLRWDLGEFSWEPNAAVDPEVGIMVSVENLIMEASRRLDELEVITRKIPSGRTVLKMADKPPEGAVEINITPEEWRILVLVDGTRTVAQIGDLVGLDEFDAMRTLYGLVSAGLIEVDMTAESGAEEPGEAPATQDAAEAAEEAAPADDTDEEAADPQDEGRSDDEVDPESASAGASTETIDADAGPDDDLDLDAPAPAAITTGSPGADLIAEQGANEETSFDDSVFDAEAQAVAEAFGDAAQDPADELVHQAAGQLDPSELVQDPADELVHQAAGQLDPSELVQDSDDSDGDTSSETVPDSWFVEPAISENSFVDHAASASPDDPAVPADSFDEPAPGEMETHEPPSPADSILNDLLGEMPDDEVTPARAESDVPDAPRPSMENTPEPPADAPRVDRAAVVRELAGLFGGEEEQRPRARATSSSSRPAEPDAPPEAVDGDQRKRVEDDDQVNRGLISRLIDGVKGL
jgi:hypothetical protein